MEACLGRGCGRPVECLGSGRLVGLRRLLQRANYISAPSGWEQGANGKGPTAGPRYEAGAGIQAGVECPTEADYMVPLT